MDNCYKHLDTGATAICSNCNRPICSECEKKEHEQIFCSSHCITQFNKTRRSEIFNYMTSVKFGIIYWAFFVLALFPIYFTYQGDIALDKVKGLLPYVFAYAGIGLVLGLVFLGMSFVNSKK